MGSPVANQTLLPDDAADDAVQLPDQLPLSSYMYPQIDDDDTQHPGGFFLIVSAALQFSQWGGGSTLQFSDGDQTVTNPESSVGVSVGTASLSCDVGSQSFSLLFKESKAGFPRSVRLLNLPDI